VDYCIPLSDYSLGYIMIGVWMVKCEGGCCWER